MQKGCKQYSRGKEDSSRFYKMYFIEQTGKSQQGQQALIRVEIVETE